jgi:hypothetical protein
LPSGTAFPFLFHGKRREPETFVLEFATALFEFVTNAPAFAPLLAELPAKRQREANTPKGKQPAINYFEGFSAFNKVNRASNLAKNIRKSEKNFRPASPVLRASG